MPGYAGIITNLQIVWKKKIHAYNVNQATKKIKNFDHFDQNFSSSLSFEIQSTPQHLPGAWVALFDI